MAICDRCHSVRFYWDYRDSSPYPVIRCRSCHTPTQYVYQQWQIRPRQIKLLLQSSPDYNAESLASIELSLLEFVNLQITLQVFVNLQITLQVYERSLENLPPTTGLVQYRGFPILAQLESYSIEPQIQRCTFQLTPIARSEEVRWREYRNASVFDGFTSYAPVAEHRMTKLITAIAHRRPPETNGQMVVEARRLGNSFAVQQAFRQRFEPELITGQPGSPSTPVTCLGCSNYCGQTYNGNKLICAIHPYGWTEGDCPDKDS